MFIYQKNSRYFGQIAEDLKALGVEELKRFGADKIEEAYRGVYFCADQKTVYSIVYQTRLFNRILAPLVKFNAHSTKYLHLAAMKVEWDQLLNNNKTFAIFANVSNSHIKHSKYASLCLKDAISDYFKEKTGARPNVDRDQPDVWLNLYIHKNKAEINLDLAGGSLHKRGYRQESVDAPLQETLAAAFIRQAGWNGETPLYDPMCGSGTILHEAHMHYCRIPASYLKKQFGFMHTPDYDKSLWDSVRKEVDSAIRPLPGNLIFGSDISNKNLDAAKINGKLLPFAENIRYKQQSYQDIKEIKDATIITNPPYGLRLNKKQNMKLFVSEIGDFLKQRCTGTTAYIYFGERELIKSVGLRSSAKTIFNNGGLDGRLVKYVMY